jgi:hypothetical protein
MTLRIFKKGPLLKDQNYILLAGLIGIQKRRSWSSTITRRYILRSLNILGSLGEGKQRVIMNRNIV